MDKTSERLGQNIKRIRISKNLTQQYIATEVGVTKQTICKIEKNGTANQSTIDRIAKALFVDVKELYEPAPDKKAEEPQINNFITIDEREASLHHHILPVYKYINDVVAKRYASTIKEKCHLSKSDIEQLLTKHGYHENTYSADEVYEICEKLNNHFILHVYDILNGNIDE